jgi:hypothetical protein
MSKDIVKALVTKKFSEAKDLVFQSLYAKTALAMDDARMGVASSVFNSSAEQVDESGKAKLRRMRRSQGRAWARGDAEKMTSMGTAIRDKTKKEDKKDINRTGSVQNMTNKRADSNRKRLGIGEGTYAVPASPAEQDRVVEDVMDDAAKKATRKSLGKLADKATKFISGSSYGKAMGKYLNAHDKAEKRAASPYIRYTAKGGRVIKAK